ncbi:MAG: glycosyltransferase family 4 protein [Ardenticatenaceae bacterium]|nr:glycosyltransferase family 4 protein [Ardenticatenaceae bacterium]
MNDVLLTVSGTIPADIEGQIERGERPLTDYIAMARTFNADLIDFAEARRQTGFIGKLMEKIGGPKLMLAWACFILRKKYRVIFTDGEQIGLPLAVFLKFLGLGAHPRHLMIVHILSVGKKMILIDWLKLQSHIDLFLVYATRQKEFIEDRWKVPGDRVIFTPFMVDANFFAPDQAGQTQDLLPFDPGQRPIICSVGLEFRDYPTLMEAVKGLDVQVVIAAGSPWSKRSDTTADQEIPDNVLVRRFTQFELRDLYAISAFMVMPLFNVEFQAGVTALLEAMALEKAVICSATPGQTDVVVEGETGLYVPPENAAALREVIVKLLDNPEEAARMGRNGRKRIVDYMSLERYVERLNQYVQGK